MATVLLTLPETLDALQGQMTALQQQMAALTPPPSAARARARHSGGSEPSKPGRPSVYPGLRPLLLALVPPPLRQPSPPTSRLMSSLASNMGAEETMW